MVERKEYLQQLLSWKDEQVIKVVTGIRRCGKSTLLQQYQNLLRQQGVAQEQIISINFEDLDYEALLDYKALYRYVKKRLQPDRMTYIFLDEIQKVPFFEKAVDSLYVQPNTDLYITGSNAYPSSRIPTSISLAPTPTCCRATWRPFSQAGMWKFQCFLSRFENL